MGFVVIERSRKRQNYRIINIRGGGDTNAKFFHLKSMLGIVKITFKDCKSGMDGLFRMTRRKRCFNTISKV